MHRRGRTLPSGCRLKTPGRILDKAQTSRCPSYAPEAWGHSPFCSDPDSRDHLASEDPAMQRSSIRSSRCTTHSYSVCFLVKKALICPSLERLCCVYHFKQQVPHLCLRSRVPKHCKGQLTQPVIVRLYETHFVL